MFWLALSAVSWPICDYETLGNWHCSLSYPMLYKDHSAWFCTPSPEQDPFRLQIEVFTNYVIGRFFSSVVCLNRNCILNLENAIVVQVKDNLKLSVWTLCKVLHCFDVFWIFAFFFLVCWIVSHIHSCWKTHRSGQEVEITCKEELSHARSLPCWF